MEQLLRDGAHPDEWDEFGNPPLHAAAFYDAPEVVRLLLEHGADPDSTNRQGFRMLHRAARMGRAGMAHLLCAAGADVDARTPDDGSTALHLAAAYGWRAMIATLCEHGADLEARDGQGQTPLMVAKAEAKSLLIALGASHSLADALRFGTPRDLERFLDQGVPVSTRIGLDLGAVVGWLQRGEEMKGGASLLVEAARSSTAEMVALLLSRGADPDGELFDETTPLVCAVGAGSAEVVRLLLEHGADPNRAARDGTVPIDVLPTTFEAPPWEAEAAEPPLAQLLFTHGAIPTPQWIVEHGDLDRLRQVLERGVQVDRADRNGWTALHVAADLEKVKMMRALLAAGANPNQADHSGTTPLHLAADARAEMVELLLAAGADPNAVDNNGNTPLHSALKFLHTSGVSIPVVERLLAAGARPDPCNREGKTPFELSRGQPMHFGPGEDGDGVSGRRDRAVAAVWALLVQAGAETRPPRPSHPLERLRGWIGKHLGPG